MLPLVNDLYRPTALSQPSKTMHRRRHRPLRIGRPTTRSPAPKALPMPPAMRTPQSIEEAIWQWIDANPPQLYRGGA
ncbi:hypothetical protein ABC977_17640 [Thioalkalicoccus limnaeus]|uniref:Uncharacterized protein n=1 Tax=Thioalkalicoccus limnaeus TaxID=120681 RepID=A0ABV4BI66_9GAMM